jgi:WD40 repeat protein
MIYQFDSATGLVKSVHDGYGKGIVVVATDRRSKHIAATAGKGARLTVHLPEVDLILSSDTEGPDNFRAGAGAVAFSPDGKQLATLEDGRLVIRKTPLADATKAPPFPARGLSFAYSPDSETLAVALQDDTLRLYDREGVQEKEVFQAGAPLRSAPAFSPDGSLLAACVSQKELVVWDVKVGKELKKLSDHKNPVGFRTGVFAPDSKTFAAWHDDGAIRLWDVFTGEVVRELTHEPPGGVVPPVLVFTKDGKTLIAGGGHTITSWDVGKD